MARNIGEVNIIFTKKNLLSHGVGRPPVWVLYMGTHLTDALEPGGIGYGVYIMGYNG